MKKLIYLICIVGSMGVAFTSCKKECTCTATSDYTDPVTTTATTTGSCSDLNTTESGVTMTCE